MKPLDGGPDGPDVDPVTGLRTFFFRGQKRYRCPTFWESGDICQRDHYDPQWILEHAREPHTADGKPKPVRIVRRSSLLDQEGRQIEYEVPSDLSTVHFKK